MKIFYSDTHYEHAPAFEIFDGGVKVPHFEVPERAERILDSLRQTSWAEVLPTREFGIAPVLAVHDPEYIDFLRGSFKEWLRTEVEAGYPKEALLPAAFPPGSWRRKPKSLLGRAGFYISDLSAPITAGTYHAARDAADCALSAAEEMLTSEKTTFALCRPPGHHAGKANCGGYCYINNAAVAANWLSTQRRTALLDIDYHCGNGTQDIFYEQDDIFTISIHADPDQEYPYYCGFADETGKGAGKGYHRNFPLPAGSDNEAYFFALDQALALIKTFEAQVLVISAGMDIYEGDPLGKFKITREGIRQIGERIASLGLPSVVVMEGGYNNEALGENMVSLLGAFQ